MEKDISGELTGYLTPGLPGVDKPCRAHCKRDLQNGPVLAPAHRHSSNVTPLAASVHAISIVGNLYASNMSQDTLRTGARRLEQGLAQYLIKGAAWLRERGPMLMVTSQVPFTNFLIPAGVEQQL